MWVHVITHTRQRESMYKLQVVQCNTIVIYTLILFSVVAGRYIISLLTMF